MTQFFKQYNISYPAAIMTEYDKMHEVKKYIYIKQTDSPLAQWLYLFCPYFPDFLVLGIHVKTSSEIMWPIIPMSSHAIHHDFFTILHRITRKSLSNSSNTQSAGDRVNTICIRDVTNWLRISERDNELFWMNGKLWGSIKCAFDCFQCTYGVLW